MHAILNDPLSRPRRYKLTTLLLAGVEKDAVPELTAMLGNTIALRQQPPSKACAFDIFVWVPEFPTGGTYKSYNADESGS